MFEQKNLNIWWRVLLSIILLAVLIGGGLAVYRFAFVQGAFAAEAGDLAADSWYSPLLGDRLQHPYHRPFFPFGSIFFGFFFLMLVFGLFRRIIFGPRWAHWGHPYGPGMPRAGYKYGPRSRRAHPYRYCRPWFWDWDAEEDEENEEKSE